MQSLIRFTLTLSAAVALILAAPALADVDADREAFTEAELTGTYTGVLVDPDTVIPRDLTHRITIHLDELTPQAEVERMIRLVAERGQDALDDELWKKDVGTVQIDNSLGHPIAAAFLVDGDREMVHLMLLIDRPITVGEIFSGARSTEYPFSVVEIDLEQDGGASGEMMVAAEMSYAADTLVIRNLAFQPLRILDVDKTSAS